VPGSRVMMIASSVDPNPSNTVQPKRRENSSMSRSVASLPYATRCGLSQRIHHHPSRTSTPGRQLRTAVRAGGRHVTEIAHSYFNAREVPQAAAAVVDRIGDRNDLRGLGRGPFLDEPTKV
jgi:hypothetical protein